MSEFVYLNNVTMYSPQYSLVKLEEIIDSISTQKHKALAITDYSNLYGSTRFFDKCKNKNIKPIIGTTLKFTRNNKEKNRDGSNIVLLAKNYNGYKNICKIITEANTDGFYYEPRVDVDLLSKYNNDLICILSVDNPIYTGYIKYESEELTDYYFNTFHCLYNNDLYISIWPKHNGLDKADQYVINKYTDRLIITTDTRYVFPSYKLYYAMMDTIRRRKKFDLNKQASDNIQYFLPDSDIEKYFKEHIDFTKSIKRIHTIVDECNFEFDKSYKFPKIDIDNPSDYLKQQINTGYKKISTSIPVSKRSEYKDRLRYEFDIISKHKFAEYFIIIQDIVNWAKSKNIYIGPSRGSVGGSLVGFVLGIHELDPIKYGLTVERFINDQRANMPDIDLDFEDTKRDQIIQYLIDKYGEDQTSGIGNLGTLKLKGAMKDVGKALGISFEKMNSYTKYIPYKAITFNDCISNKDFYSIYESDKQLQEIMKYSSILEGSMRQPGVHAAGIVIAPEPLVNYCPLQTVDRNTGHKSTQFDMKAVESIGLIKIDILGLTALSIMHNCLDSIKVNYNKEINLKEIPKDDSSIYEMLSNGNSAGVFQMETRNMTKLAQEIKVSSFNELRDLVAFRPGVLDAKQDKIYKYNKFNPDKYKPIHPKLGNILKQTHGILLFQESYQQAAVDLAGFSLSDGALLIRAIGKKIKDLMANMEAKWISGCEKNGLTKQEAKSIFATFHAAGNYAFNMAHSVGYATLAYQTAYLKYYYPLLYMTSLLNSEKDNHDKFMLYCQDLVKLGINLISPNINKSNSDFSANIEKNEIRYGLSAIKNVGEKAAKHIEQIRGNREFISVYDFMDRIDSSIVNKSCILALAKTGCFEEIGNISRETIVNNIDTIINFYRKAKCNYTNSLFKIKPIIKESERINPYIIRQWEQELMGTSF